MLIYTLGMIYLHKILPVLLSPIFLFSVLVLVGTYKRWRGVCYAAAAGLWLLAVPVVSDNLFRFVEEYSVKRNASSIPDANAIVVLSGMLKDSPGEEGVVSEWGDPDRFFGGLELYKAGKAKSLVFTRGRMPWAVSQEAEGDILERTAIESGVPKKAILLTAEVANTREEAAAVKALLGDRGMHIILVTSAFHMARARTVFEREGFKVTAYPVDFKVNVEKTTIMDLLPDGRALLLSDLAIREIVGRLYYKFASLS